PLLGISAIDRMNDVLTAIRRELAPALVRRRTSMPVVPDAARHATINVNGIDGGQPVGGIQTPCVADRCRAVFDRRFLLEEGFESARQEIDVLVRRALESMPAVRYELRDVMIVHPVTTPDGSPLVAALEGAV